MSDDYRNFYESSPIAFWRTSINDGQFLMANQACAKLLGHDSVEELLKDKSIHLYVNGDRKHILDELKVKGEIADYPTELVLGNGKHIWVAVSGKSYPDEGYIEGSLADITAQKVLDNKVSIEVQKLAELKKDMKAKIKEMSVSLPARSSAKIE